MRETKIPCIICPTGCEMTVTGEKDATMITGHLCPRGERYARQEFTAPMRIFTGLARVRDGEAPVVSVRALVPRDLVLDCARFCKALAVDAPVTFGQVLEKNLLGTGAALTATAAVAKNGRMCYTREVVNTEQEGDDTHEPCV